MEILLFRFQKADISAAFLPILPSFWHNISYSAELDVGEFVVMMQRPKESATGSGLLAPFTTPVWFLIILSLLVVGPLIHFIIFLRAKLCRDDESKIYSMQSCMWFVYGALLKQGTTLSPTTGKKTSLRCISMPLGKSFIDLGRNKEGRALP